MKVEVQDGDVVFKRAQNGWIIHRASQGGEYMETYVVEDISDDPTDALWCALQEAYSDASE
jgi:hypothetical protein|tara:strand:+ start:399 stop:581 length:183 start_codon:yes stop_codon:yes gene_type:complete